KRGIKENTVSLEGENDHSQTERVSKCETAAVCVFRLQKSNCGSPTFKQVRDNSLGTERQLTATKLG
ncbi:hypothetical protein J6590_073704, partial [Homalodisca vitripennis]